MPIWILLAKANDWRWLLDREDTPWYPTVRLFRQERPNDWAIDTRHLPLYWFPRDCPRGTFWATAATLPADAERRLLEQRLSDADL